VILRTHFIYVPGLSGEPGSIATSMLGLSQRSTTTLETGSDDSLPTVKAITACGSLSSRGPTAVRALPEASKARMRHPLLHRSPHHLDANNFSHSGPKS
jgi:hypothetical protein